MKVFLKGAIAGVICSIGFMGVSQQISIPETVVKESKASIQRGVNYLTDKQDADGSWMHSPALTALSLMALQQSRATELKAVREEAIERGRQFILKFVQKDGAICTTERRYLNYSTAVCTVALALINNPKDKVVLKNARHFLIDLQLDEDNKNNPTKKSNKSYGGIGYGKRGPAHPDLSNTQWALEALWLTEKLDSPENGATKAEKAKSDLAWKNALIFLQRVQSVPESSDEKWIVGKHDGGFRYQPDESKVKDENGKTLRSYGSMTYAGLKSMIYAKLKKDDPRVKAAVKWAQNNYTLDENPGMGPQGQFYYIHTFTKALSALGEETIVDKDGKKHQWRQDVLKKLLDMQQGDGSWVNKKSGRWMESVPTLVTAYALISMELALGPKL